jgi:hypothetical protein
MVSGKKDGGERKWGKRKLMATHCTYFKILKLRLDDRI